MFERQQIRFALPFITSSLAFRLTTICKPLYNKSNPPEDSIFGPTPALTGGLSLNIGKFSMKRVIAYIDGYNLYYGLRSKGWKKYYWLNIQKLVSQFLRPQQTLIATKYFTTIIKYPDGKRRRQQVFLESLKTLPNFHIFYGHFLADKITCRKCGHTYTTYHEKMTDVNIAVELMQDAFEDPFDLAFLISADSDLVGPISAVQRSFPGKKVISIFPPKRSSYAIKQVSNGVLHIGRNELSKSIFPDQVIKDGVTLHRPAKWH